MMLGVGVLQASFAVLHVEQEQEQEKEQEKEREREKEKEQQQQEKEEEEHEEEQEEHEEEQEQEEQQEQESDRVDRRTFRAVHAQTLRQQLLRRLGGAGGHRHAHVQPAEHPRLHLGRRLARHRRRPDDEIVNNRK